MRAQKTILIVEDNEGNRMLERDICTLYGYKVIEATDGASGIQMAREFCPDLIIIDIQMPVMDGYTAIQKLKEDPATRDITIIAITSFAMVNDRTRILDAGADEYISKPINTRELPLLIKRYLGEGGE